MFKTIIVIVWLCVFPLSAISAQGVWTTMQGNPAHTGMVKQTVNSNHFKVLWTKRLFTNEGGSSARWYTVRDPAVTDQLLYLTVSSDRIGNIFALDVVTGKTVWQIPMDYYNGLSAPAFANDRVFITAQDQTYNHSTLRAYKASTGKLLFTLPIMEPNFDSYSTPLAVGDAVFVQALELHRSNAATGRHVWVQKESQVWFQPTYNKKQLFIPDTNVLHIIDAETGRLTADIPVDAGDYFGGLSSASVLDESRQMLYSQWQSGLVGVDLAAKNVRFRANINTGGQPLLSDDALIVEYYRKGQDDAITALDPNTGDQLWEWSPNNGDELPPGSSMVSTGDVIFVRGTKNTYAVSTKTHQTVWMLPIVGRMALGLNALFIMSEDATVTAVGLN